MIFQPYDRWKPPERRLPWVDRLMDWTRVSSDRRVLTYAYLIVYIFVARGCYTGWIVGADWETYVWLWYLISVRQRYKWWFWYPDAEFLENPVGGILQIFVILAVIIRILVYFFGIIAFKISMALLSTYFSFYIIRGVVKWTREKLYERRNVLVRQVNQFQRKKEKQQRREYYKTRLAAHEKLTTEALKTTVDYNIVSFFLDLFCYSCWIIIFCVALFE